MTWLTTLAGVPAYRPFVLAYMATGDETPLLALCDLIEEGDDPTFRELARHVRASLFPN